MRPSGFSTTHDLICIKRNNQISDNMRKYDTQVNGHTDADGWKAVRMDEPRMDECIDGWADGPECG